MGFHVLAINPGSTSTKVGWFDEGVESWHSTVSHDPGELAAFPAMADQFDFRMRAIEKACEEHGNHFSQLDAVVGRGGLLDPIPGGTYAVDPVMKAHLSRGKPWEHASNLGGILADAIAEPRGIPALIVDPVAVDELDDVARLTGLPELPKRSLVHALNVKATVRRAARDLNGDWKKMDFVVAHLGGGISICAHRQGRIIDTNNANEFGPFSPERAGGLPAGDLARLCFSGRYTLQDLRKRLVGSGGLVAYTGESDVRKIKALIAGGDESAALAYRAMAFQVAREIGAAAAAMGGKIDAILLTGGVAHDSDFVAMVTERVQWIAPVLAYPGEDELSALAEGAMRVLRKEETPMRYGDFVKTEA
ncbi:MAG: butyrate kinase [Synergistales bacterium]|jgi:butyrate kinase